jgi:hypothetical protein
MVRNRFHSYILAGMLAAGAGLTPAATIVGGLEDTPGSSGYEKNGDFNDMMFELAGNITIDAPGGVFNNLTASVVNQNGTVFWDNPSLDGPDMNIGYMLLSDHQFQNLQYLALPGGGSVNNVTFDATGPVTLTFLGGLAADRDTLGWYNPADPGVLHQLAAVTEPAGETVTFNPNGEFALYAANGSGQFYSSIAASNVGESGTEQHFALFEEPQGLSQAPEPSSGALASIGVALVGLGMLHRKNRRV